ncbi:hypothetical protein [Rhizobium binxianense]
MTKVILIGVQGEEGLWLVDLESRKVEPFNDPTGELAKATELRKLGATFIKNVNFALGVSSAKVIFSGHVDS